VDRLIAAFAKLPGIGRRSAERMAHWVLRASAEDAARLSGAIDDVKRSVRSCSVCANFADGAVCRVCDDARRDRSLVLVVEQARDLIALEATGMYRGLYHVLMGRISPLDGVSASDLTVARLLKRVDDPASNPGGEAVREIILGLNPTLEGDGTGLYLAQALAQRGVKVSRLARGLPSGGQIELANKAVLGDAIEGRRAV
jgi:recombination protein RecR